VTGGLPDAATIAASLAAINASAEFARAPVMRHLLGYLVDETIAGRGDRLKAYSVAVDALGRSADFDAQTDSYPRVQVGRLRRMLDAFYATGPAVPLRLVIPLGAYRVQFDDMAGDGADVPATGDWADHDGPRSAGSARRRIVLAILCGVFVLAIGLAAVAWLELLPQRRTPVPKVVPPPSLSIEIGDAAQSPAERARIGDVVRRMSTAFTRSAIAEVNYGARTVDSRYALLLDLGTDGISLSIRLIDRRGGQLHWADMIALPNDPAALEEAVRPAISALVRPSGIVAADQRVELRDDFSPGYPCLLHYDAYFRERDAALRAPVRACIARTIELDPTYAEALAAASFLLINPVDGPVSDAARGRAMALARRASAADPYSPVAVVAEARLAFMDGNCVRGQALAERAVKLDSYDPETLGLIGMLMVQCDKPRALALLQSARALDPELTTFYMSALVLLELDAGRADEAAAIADGMRPPGPGMMRQYLVAQTLGSIAQGDDARARALWQQLVERTPPPRDTVDAVLSRSYLAPEFRLLIAKRLGQAGIVDAPVKAAS
jgi:tetratricopeptide (TPR) repeat protein